MRVTASLREDTPSFRYMDIASDFTVCRDMWSRCPISAMERCVGSKGTSLSSAAVNDAAPAMVPWTAPTRARRRSTELVRLPRSGRCRRIPAAWSRAAAAPPWSRNPRLAWASPTKAWTDTTGSA